MEEELVSKKLRKLGFAVLETNGAELYLLETPYYFLVIEEVFGKYSFIKYSFNSGKKETRIVKLYFDNYSEKSMLRRVGSYIRFMIENKYLKTSNREILEFAREISETKIFV
ncbi:hypothetical protein [Enterococcus sp. LJL51]|uniref:hypothetical protein n=1 Tax=Enterococcus sp. LJL51 TaxID=3416656 RepID=UPI003CF20759